MFSGKQNLNNMCNDLKLIIKKFASKFLYSVPIIPNCTSDWIKILRTQNCNYKLGRWGRGRSYKHFTILKSSERWTHNVDSEKQ